MIYSRSVFVGSLLPKVFLGLWFKLGQELLWDMPMARPMAYSVMSDHNHLIVCTVAG